MFINNFDPVAFSLFSLEFRWYSLSYIFGILAGWVLAKRIFIKELRFEFKYRKKIAYRSAKLLIPSIYIIKKRNQGIIQAKWIFLGTEQKRIHLGMCKNIAKYDDKKLRNLTIKIINKNYGAPFNSLSFTWIDKEKKRLKKWQNTINNKNLVYKKL